MLPVVIKWLTRQVSLAGEVGKLRDEVEHLQEDNCTLREEMLRLRFEMQAALARETAEREKFMLQIQNLLLQWERRLPPPAAKPSAKRAKRVKRGG